MSNKVFVCGMDTSTLPKITNKENINLLTKVRNKEAGAKQEFIYNNMRLVLSTIKRFKFAQELTDDVFQVGIIGLIKAMNGFNLNINVQFSTYAVPMIMGEIKRFLRSRTSIKVSRSLRDTAYHALQAKEQLSKQGKEATTKNIAEILNTTAKQIEDAFNAISDPISLFETIYEGKDGSVSLIEQLEDNCKYEENWIESSLLENGIKTLSSREKQILILRYYVGKTQTEISQEIGISQAQVSRLEKTALLTLKKLF